MKKFIPLLFTTDMMVANLEQIKNNTRRGSGLKLINENPRLWELHMINQHNYISAVFNEVDHDMSEKRVCEIKCPYGKPGDVLWFREKWRRNEAMTGSPFHWYALNDVYTSPDNEIWKPGIHMPASACRAWGIVEEIRIERLNDITEHDAINEGVADEDESDYVESPDQFDCVGYKDYMNKGEAFESAKDSYRSLFQSINGKELTDKNPWLWVVRYKFTTEEPDGWKEYVNSLKK